MSRRSDVDLPMTSLVSRRSQPRLVLISSVSPLRPEATPANFFLEVSLAEH